MVLRILIHHIEWCVSNLDKISFILRTQFGFTETSYRNASFFRQKELQRGEVRFIVTERKNEEKVFSIFEDEYPVFFCCSSQNSHTRDSVFNIVFVVQNEQNRQNVLIQTGASNSSFVHFPSLCSNVYHTVLKKHYTLLPGFTATSESTNHLGFFNLDHVTFVCHYGQSQDIMKWYHRVFGLTRFFVNSFENDKRGLEIGSDVQMRLMAGEWLHSWLCSEKMVGNTSFKLVLAEPLHKTTFSHVTNFLTLHNGPGIQHIGVSINHIVNEVEIMVTQGCSFRQPPPTYYSLPSKKTDIIRSGEDYESFCKLGLLIDSEVNGLQNSGESNEFLIQIFTKPIFEKDTFFLEILERKGAKGFGAGNIIALAQSIILYETALKEKES